MKKKGFTLIELLAVIVILAVIALIATPMILNVIETARVGAAKSSAQGYLDALELYISTSELENKTRLKSNQRYNLTKTTIIGEQAYLSINDLIDIKGDIPTGIDDYIVLGDNYKIIEGQLTLNGYIVIIQNEEMIVTKGELIEVEEISLNFDNQTMERGSTTKIKVTFTPENASNQKVSYKSSNDEIVSVDEYGNIKALQNGNATITVTSNENKDIEKTINIEVISPENVESITLAKEEKEIYIGDTIQITATLNPSDATSNALTWTSDNEEVAIVDNTGLVTGLGIGKANITATTTNGKTASIEVEIKGVLAESITISGNSIAGLNKTTQYTATILPEDTTDKTVTWKSSDETIATIDSTGLVTGLKEGAVTITATTSNNIVATKEISVQELKLCMRADVETLHTETCTQTNGKYFCSGSSKYNTGSTITYGNETVTDELVSGDAFDCDVNGDGTYDPTTERFYYVSGLNGDNTSNVKVLIYYNNTSRDSNGNIKPDNTPSSLIAYYPSVNENWHGPTEAIKNLPTVNEWTNVALTNTSRNITNESDGLTTNNGSNAIENPFVYKNANNVDYAARLLTYKEVATACGAGTVTTIGYLDACNYLMENTKYSASSMETYGYWLETPLAAIATNAWYVNGSSRYVNTTGVPSTSNYGVRPAIEVLESNISY